MSLFLNALEGFNEARSEIKAEQKEEERVEFERGVINRKLGQADRTLDQADDRIDISAADQGIRQTKADQETEVFNYSKQIGLFNEDMASRLRTARKTGKSAYQKWVMDNEDRPAELKEMMRDFFDTKELTGSPFLGDPTAKTKRSRKSSLGVNQPSATGEFTDEDKVDMIVKSMAVFESVEKTEKEIAEIREKMTGTEGDDRARLQQDLNNLNDVLKEKSAIKEGAKTLLAKIQRGDVSATDAATASASWASQVMGIRDVANAKIARRKAEATSFDKAYGGGGGGNPEDPKSLLDIRTGRGSLNQAFSEALEPAATETPDPITAPREEVTLEPQYSSPAEAVTESMTQAIDSWDELDTDKHIVIKNIGAPKGSKITKASASLMRSDSPMLRRNTAPQLDLIGKEADAAISKALLGDSPTKTSRKLLIKTFMDNAPDVIHKGQLSFAIANLAKVMVRDGSLVAAFPNKSRGLRTRKELGKPLDVEVLPNK